MKTSWIRALLERYGIVNPRVAPPTRKTRKARAKCKPAVTSHAAAVKVKLLNAVADALGRAPAEFDPATPKTTIAVNGSLYTVHNTVDALSAFQSRLEKLQTTPGKAPGVPRAARKFRLSRTP